MIDNRGWSRKGSAGKESESDNSVALDLFPIFPVDVSVGAIKTDENHSEQKKKNLVPTQKVSKPPETRSVNTRNIFRLRCTLKYHNTIPVCQTFASSVLLRYRKHRAKLHIRAHIFFDSRVYNARHILFPSRPGERERGERSSLVKQKEWARKHRA